MSGLIKELIDKLSAEQLPVATRALTLKKTRLALKTSGQVNFVCRVGDYDKAGIEYNGAMRILANMMNSDYLWNNVRVKGGAYGCGAAFGSFQAHLAHSHHTGIRTLKRQTRYMIRLRSTLRASMQTSAR